MMATMPAVGVETNFGRSQTLVAYESTGFGTDSGNDCTRTFSASLKRSRGVRPGFPASSIKDERSVAHRQL